MTSFRNNEIARVNHSKKYHYPDELSIAVFLDRMKWTYFDYLATPSHVINAILFKWQIDDELEKKRQAKNKS